MKQSQQEELIGAARRAMREALDWSPIQHAAAAETSVNTIYAAERGDPRMLLETLLKLERAGGWGRGCYVLPEVEAPAPAEASS